MVRRSRSTRTVQFKLVATGFCLKPLLYLIILPNTESHSSVREDFYDRDERSPPVSATAGACGPEDGNGHPRRTRAFLGQGFFRNQHGRNRQSGQVSKATLYAYFPSKETLFAFLIMAECEACSKDLPLPTIYPKAIPALQKFARQYVRAFIERKDIAFVHTIANESNRFPDLGRLFGSLATIRAARPVSR